jgi:acyl carrier protein
VLDRPAVLDIIKDKIQARAAEASDVALSVDESTSLFGEESVLDSLALVDVLLDVEQEVNGKLGTDLVLADDRAMSEKLSPFGNPGRLADYVMKLINEQSAR